MQQAASQHKVQEATAQATAQAQQAKATAQAHQAKAAPSPRKLAAPSPQKLHVAQTKAPLPQKVGPEAPHARAGCMV